MDAAIREATPADARAIAEVHVASWRWAYRGLMDDAILDGLSVDDREAQWRQAASSDGILLVAEREGAIVGFVRAGAPLDGDPPAGTAEVHAIYVVEDAAGRGIGHALLAAAREALARAGYGGATLWVLETNERARRFYEREGWVWDGTRSAHPPRNELIVRYATSWDPA